MKASPFCLILMLLLAPSGLAESRSPLCTTTKRTNTFTGYTVLRQIYPPPQDSNTIGNYTVVYCVDDRALYLYHRNKDTVRLALGNQNNSNNIKEKYGYFSVVGTLDMNGGEFPLLMSNPIPFITVDYKASMQVYVPLFHTPSSEQML